jgi:hypothetical protein
MKLDRLSVLAVLLVCATGCGTSTALAPVAARPSALHVMAAELRESDDAPKVGKSQRTDASVLDDEDGKHEVASHGGVDRKHGGFSGYK